jgi:hypothetical protein
MASEIITLKFCSKCNTSKSIEFFSKSKSRKDGLNGFCKQCLSLYSLNNQAYKKRRAECHIENKEANNKRTSDWRKNNPDYAKRYMQEWLKENKPKKALADKKYRENNKDILREKRRPCKVEHNRRREFAKSKAFPIWACTKSIKEIYKKAESLREQGFSVEVDHIVPLVSKLVCGLHTQSNLQIISKDENLTKGNRFWPNMP